jgi:hypothetical protein
LIEFSITEDRRFETVPVIVIEPVIASICDLPWQHIDNNEVLHVAHVYYYFSIQFRENLQICSEFFPDDMNIKKLYEAECATDNLSPWPGIADIGEKLDHDEFVRRLLALQPIKRADELERAGHRYLAIVRKLDRMSRAASIRSYEDGGLSQVFTAMLRAPHWNGPGQQAFRFFLEQHILFDSDEVAGHGALSRHLTLDAGVLALWSAFREILMVATPKFVTNV